MMDLDVIVLSLQFGAEGGQILILDWLWVNGCPPPPLETINDASRLDKGPFPLRSLPQAIDSVILKFLTGQEELYVIFQYMSFFVR